MITYKFNFKCEDIFNDFLNEGNKIVRIAFNQFKKGYDLKNVEKHIINKYNYSDIIDRSMLKWFCQDAESIYKSFEEKKSNKLIFGGKNNYKKYLKGLITKQEFFDKRNTKALSFVGSKLDNHGNRKFELHIESGYVLFKLNRKNHFKLSINFKKRYNDLLKIQMLAEQHQCPITYRLSNEYIYISFDESFLKKSDHEFIKDRVAGLDLNPNYIGFTIRDGESKTIYKEVIDLTNLNQTYNKNKKDYELIHIAKRLSNLCKHYKVEIVGYEDLNIKSKNHNKGKTLNRLINNLWNRNCFINNFKKRLNILGIKNQSIKAEYSSTIGCLNYPEETDSVAAALEISRRVYYFKKKYLDKDKEFLDKDIIYPKLDYKLIQKRWNSILSEYNPPNKVGYKSIHNYLKKQKKLTQLRFLFKDYDFSSWSFLRYQSRKNLTSSYFSI